MSPRRTPFSREEYESRAGANLGKASWDKPAVRTFHHAGTECLVKDYAHLPWLLRETYGRLSVEWEAVIYERLFGLAGVPRFLGVIDAHAFAMTRVAGREAGTFPKGSLPLAALDALGAVIEGIHRRGVIHSDLRQRRNILIDEAGRPHIIDFASALILPPGSWLHRLLCRLDRSGALKLRLKHAPDTLAPDERRSLDLARFRPFRQARVRRQIRKKAHQRGRTPGDARKRGQERSSREDRS